MLFEVKPGNALLCKVNAHRSGWDGQICQDASSWNCGAKLDFRRDYCEAGNPRCYHIHLFDERDPYFLIDDKGAGWIFEPIPSAFDDQILLFYGPEFREPRGARDVSATQVVFGAYRVKKVIRREEAYRILWAVLPYEDGWSRFEHLRIEVPYHRKLDGPYVREVEKTAVLKIFRQAKERAAEPGRDWPSTGLKDRFDVFASNVESWLEEASARQPAPRRVMEREPRTSIPTPPSGSFATIGDVLPPIETRTQAAVDTDTPSEKPQTTIPIISETERRPHGSLSAVPGLLDDDCAAQIVRLYGEAVLQGLVVGLLTKTVVLFAGRPGVGKSRLAARLVGEAGRRLIVPVASTWRGREDLFGYVNPISGEFEPTAFTNFLREAEVAESAGDTRVRLVIFEEYNLSPPEHWFSEILVRSQYHPGQREARTIVLGGKRVRGWQDNKTSVYLSPYVRFVGTINIDHTTRQLSPRVLDRAAVVEITLEPERALEEAGVELDARQLEAVRDLNFRLRNTAVMFSLRSAFSLQACLERADLLGIDAWGAIDLVLTQEVLSKVSLMAADPADLALCDQLMAWSEEYSKELPRSASRIASWNEMLEQGRDIVQA